MKDVIVVGGGTAGFVAAIAAGKKKGLPQIRNVYFAYQLARVRWM